MLFALLSTRCCISDLDARVLTKGFITAWRSKDKHRAALRLRELLFREMFPYELQVKKFPLSFRKEETRFFFLGQ